jgi:hypothetical protein
MNAASMVLGSGLVVPARVRLSTRYEVKGFAPVPVDEVLYRVQHFVTGLPARDMAVRWIEDRPEVVGSRNGIAVIPVSRIRRLFREVFGRVDLATIFGDHLLWADGFWNLVVNEGLDDVLNRYFKGSGYTAAHYVGLTGSTPSVAAGDTMADHGGWTEVTAYDEAARVTPTWGSVSSQNLDNSGSPADFTISTNNTTMGGAFLATNSTKGGSTGTLYGGGAFSAGDKTLDDDDTLSVTVTLTASAS